MAASVKNGAQYTHKELSIDASVLQAIVRKPQNVQQTGAHSDDTSSRNSK